MRSDWSRIASYVAIITNFQRVATARILDVSYEKMNKMKEKTVALIITSSSVNIVEYSLRIRRIIVRCLKCSSLHGCAGDLLANPGQTPTEVTAVDTSYMVIVIYQTHPPIMHGKTSCQDGG